MRRNPQRDMSKRDIRGASRNSGRHFNRPGLRFRKRCHNLETTIRTARGFSGVERSSLGLWDNEKRSRMVGQASTFEMCGRRSSFFEVENDEYSSFVPWLSYFHP